MSISRRLLTGSGVSAARTGVSPEDYLGRGWFPVNGNLLREIKERIAKGAYEGKPHDLVSDIEKDYALLTHAFKQVRGSPEFAADPLGTVRRLPLEELKKILSVSEGDVSSHALGEAVKFQTLRFKHTIVATATADAISERAGIDSQLAVACALGRQIGLHLAAWNYPRIYSKVLSGVATQATDLETGLLKALGFSPRSLGIQLTFGTLSEEIRGGMGLNGSDSGNGEGAHISKICEIGESLARMNDPEHFPNDTRNWRTIVTSIGEYLGPKGLSLIRERVEAQSASYLTLSSKVFDSDISPERNLEIANQHLASSLLATNSHASKVSQEVREVLLRVYKHVKPGEVSTDAVQLLVSELIPATGFHKGCVYIFDPGKQALVPRLRIGGRPLEHYKAYFVGTQQLSENPIVDALYSPIPIRQDNALLFGDSVSHVTGSIGAGERTGVLFLEMAGDLASKGSLEAVQRFRVVRHCLNDCLGLGQGPG